MLFTAFEFSGFLFAYMSTQHPATSKKQHYNIYKKIKQKLVKHEFLT